MLKEGSLYHRKWYSSAAGPWEDRPGESRKLLLQLLQEEVLLFSPSAQPRTATGSYHLN